MSNNRLSYTAGSTELSYYKYAENKAKYSSPEAAQNSLFGFLFFLLKFVIKYNELF